MHPAVRHPFARLAALLPSVLLIACGGGDSGATPPPPPPPPPAAVASVEVAPGTASLVVGASQQFAATTKDAAGNVLTGRAITWGSSNTAIATVNASGLVTAVAAGSTTVTATSEGRSGQATVTVSVPPPTVASVSIVPATVSLVVGATQQLVATPRDVTGAAITGRTVTWASGNAAVASVTSAGLVTAVAAGSTTITATADGRGGLATVTVTPVPVASIAFAADSIDVALRSTRQLTATLRDAAGNVLTGRTITWSVAPASLASITSVGAVRTLLPGTVTVTAQSEGRTATMRVRGSLATLSTMVDSIRAAFGVPGMGAAIVSREGLIGLGAAGMRRVSGGLPVTVNDKWHLGSNTKAMTGILAGMAVDAGVLSWSRTAAQAFPDVVGLRAEYAPVTLSEFLSHLSGVVNTNQGLTGSTNYQAARTAWATYTLQQPPNNTRGTYYYSNNGFGIAGAMVERAWGASYEQLMASRIFTPLGMTGVGWGPTTTAGGQDQPVGHRAAGTTGWTVCEACDNPPGLSSAGTVHMPLSDWARLMQELLLADQGRSSLLSQGTARFLTTNAVPAGGGFSYGMGWGISTGAQGTRIAAHDGSNTTNHSRAQLYLDAGVGFLVTTNATEIPGRTANAITAMVTRLDRYWSTGQ